MSTWQQLELFNRKRPLAAPGLVRGRPGEEEKKMSTERPQTADFCQLYLLPDKTFIGNNLRINLILAFTSFFLILQLFFNLKWKTKEDIRTRCSLCWNGMKEHQQAWWEPHKTPEIESRAREGVEIKGNSGLCGNTQKRYRYKVTQKMPFYMVRNL